VKKTFNKVSFLPEFEKDLKELKRFRTLRDDLDVFIAHQLKLKHKLKIDNKGIVSISGLGIECPEIYKARKFPCKALRGRGAASGIRVIYAYYEKEDIVEFVEIYYKGDRENEDRGRILKHFGNKAP